MKHIVSENLQDCLPKPSIEVTRAILPELAKLDSRWTKVIHEKTFNTTYQCHKDLNQVIYNALAKDQVKNLLKTYGSLMLKEEEDDCEEEEEELSDDDQTPEKEVINDENQIKEKELPEKNEKMSEKKIQNNEIEEPPKKLLGQKRPVMENAASALGFDSLAKVQKLNEMTDLYLEMEHHMNCYKFKLAEWRRIRDSIRPQLSTPRHSFDKAE